MMSRLWMLSIICSFQVACNSNPYVQGARIYENNCANCHMENGEGLRSLIPPIAASDYYLKNYTKLPCIILNGQNEKIIVNGIEYHEVMPALKLMTAAEMTNLINYMNHRWYADKQVERVDSIAQRMENCK